ncbi:hypothetical protein ABZ863_02685 [Saccharomonospora sp. NPDC046836]|uniref:hypothetical protein n=1 Tax=Saccharomonospora sp. NPDC046836 TaxID=3156921 RepID=UPI00340B551C
MTVRTWALPGFTEVKPLGEGSFGQVVLARQDDRVISVRYRLDIRSAQFGNHGGYDLRLVSVDLRSGRPLHAADVFAAAATAPSGAAELEERIVDQPPGGYCPASVLNPTSSLTPDELRMPYTVGGYPVMQTGYSADAVEFLVFTPAFGYEMACGYRTFTVPYAQVTELMTEDAAAALAPGPQPTR